MHTVLHALMILFFAICLVGTFCWCLSRAFANIPVWLWAKLSQLPGLRGDPWPGWHQEHDPEWVNEISQPMPAITGAVVPPQSLDAKVKATIARANAMHEQTQELLAVTDERA